MKEGHLVPLLSVPPHLYLKDERRVKSEENLEKKIIGTAGFEPATPRTPSVCASQAALRPDEEAEV